MEIATNFGLPFKTPPKHPKPFIFIDKMAELSFQGTIKIETWIFAPKSEPQFNQLSALYREAQDALFGHMNGLAMNNQTNEGTNQTIADLAAAYGNQFVRKDNKFFDVEHLNTPLSRNDVEMMLINRIQDDFRSGWTNHPTLA